MPTQSADTPPPARLVRLHRFLAAAGLDSRRACEEYITAGRVEVDGEPVHELGMQIDPEKQKVKVDGQLIRQQPLRYFLINKPKGYVCTNKDPGGRPRAVDLVKAGRDLRLFTVGRLDESSEGLLLVTNDGELAHRLAHPRFHVVRTYRVQVAGIPDQATLKLLTEGLHFSDGQFRLKTARRLKTQGNSSFLELELTEGRNREIRRLFARVGHKVMQLQRIGFGPLRLKKLLTGEFRPLSSAEVTALKEFAAAPLSRRPQKAKAFKHSKRKKTVRRRDERRDERRDVPETETTVSESRVARHPAIAPPSERSQRTSQRASQRRTDRGPHRGQKADSGRDEAKTETTGQWTRKPGGKKKLTRRSSTRHSPRPDQEKSDTADSSRRDESRSEGSNTRRSVHKKTTRKPAPDLDQTTGTSRRKHTKRAAEGQSKSAARVKKSSGKSGSQAKTQKKNKAGQGKAGKNKASAKKSGRQSGKKRGGRK